MAQLRNSITCSKEGCFNIPLKISGIIRECALNFTKVNQHRERHADEKIRAAAKNSCIHLVRLGPKTGNIEIKKNTHSTSPAIGLKRVVPALAG